MKGRTFTIWKRAIKAGKEHKEPRVQEWANAAHTMESLSFVGNIDRNHVARLKAIGLQSLKVLTRGGCSFLQLLLL